jgi:hypothetical protein
MIKMKKAVIDVDEILWPFSKAFYEEVVASGIENFPVPEEFNYWSIFWEYLPKNQAFIFFDKVHCKQCLYKPYKDAKRFLEFLKEDGYYIIIASHRDPKFRDELVKWLDMNHLPYGEVHISFDKTTLFNDPDVKLVVDDRPETLVKGEAAGVTALGLLKPWNRRCGKLHLFKTLPDIIRFIKTGYEEDDGRDKR